MIIKCELELNEQKEIFEFNKIAKQANGAVLAQIGNAVVIAAVASEFDNPVSEDFTPLTVQYIEKTYASAKPPPRSQSGMRSSPPRNPPVPSGYSTGSDPSSGNFLFSDP